MLQPVEAVLFLFRSRDAVCRLLTAARQVCQLITVSLVTVLFLSVGRKGYGIGSTEMNFSDFFSVGTNDSICRKILESSAFHSKYSPLPKSSYVHFMVYPSPRVPMVITVSSAPVRFPYLPVMSPEMSSSEQEAIHVIRKRVAIRLLARRNHLFRRMDCELSVFIV